MRYRLINCRPYFAREIYRDKVTTEESFEDLSKYEANIDAYSIDFKLLGKVIDLACETCGKATIVIS